ALNVFNKRQLENFLIRDFPNDYRKRFDLGKLGCAPSAFAGDELIHPAAATNQQRLDYAIGFYRQSEVVQALLVEACARLIVTRSNLIDFDVPNFLTNRGLPGQQRAQAPAQGFLGHVAIPPYRIRYMKSLLEILGRKSRRAGRSWGPQQAERCEELRS